ncbi:hypothetical protein ACWDSJ_25955 [Nocardia sp. NPDC003482]
MNTSPTVTRLTAAYTLLSAATVVALLILSALAPDLVTDQAWVRGVIVAATSLLTYAFARRAERGEPRALLRLRIVVTVLVIAFAAVLIFLPLPGWMVVEQVIGLALLVVIAGLVFRGRRPSEVTGRS